MNQYFFCYIIDSAISFFLVNIFHELFHLLAFKLVGLNIFCFEAYPIKIYRDNNRYNIKINVNLKEYIQGFVLPEVSVVKNEMDLESKKNKIIFAALAGPVGSLILGSILKIIIHNYYISNLFINIFAIMSIIIGVLTFLFSDGIMSYRLYKEKVFTVLTLFQYNNLLLNREFNDRTTDTFIYKYANDICEELNMEEKFFYIKRDNRNQIDLQGGLLYYLLVNNIESFNINIIKNMNNLIKNLSQIKSLDGFLFEYINLIVIYKVIKENDLEEAKRIFKFIKNGSIKRNFYQEYIFNRTRYFLGEISYKQIYNSIPKSLLVNKKIEMLLFEQLENRKI